MNIIQIPNFEFTSLIDWKDPYEIQEMYSGLTIQECRLASNFQSMKNIDIKANFLIAILKSLLDRDSLKDEQWLFIIELVNCDVSIRSELLYLFNRRAIAENLDVVLEMEQNNE